MIFSEIKISSSEFRQNSGWCWIVLLGSSRKSQALPFLCQTPWLTTFWLLAIMQVQTGHPLDRLAYIAVEGSGRGQHNKILCWSQRGMRKKTLRQKYRIWTELWRVETSFWQVPQHRWSNLAQTAGRGIFQVSQQRRALTGVPLFFYKQPQANL